MSCYDIIWPREEAAMDGSRRGHLARELLLEVHGWHRDGGVLAKAYPTAGDAQALLFFTQVAIVLCGAAPRPALDVDLVGRTVRLSAHPHGRRGLARADLA